MALRKEKSLLIVRIIKFLALSLLGFKAIIFFLLFDLLVFFLYFLLRLKGYLLINLFFENLFLGQHIYNYFIVIFTLTS